ncbi:FHA domain-containing protein [Cellulosimicrobium marinum]|uniref:FHA domain-containing protein n=1 Tax=Cellulosimicrobium marinum TaxID=1638992 RepID=UPI001E2DC89A|nr:FHA domain-containing protein [Cellulosimicrobium marinum]MCB7136387.1 FHA domain-containing protein [Cellulosimicrobium marinum]
MSAVLCPAGHPSTSTDYCDVCGAPIDAGASPAATGSQPGPVEAPAAAATATSCPHCGAPAAAGALFCENCGYDFTTGALPDPVEPPSLLSLDPPSGSSPAPRGPANPAPPSPGPDAAPDAAPATDPASGSHLPTPPVPGPDQWVVEIWIDPDWYAAQQPEDPMPSAGLPGLVVLRERSVLVGRPSVSRGIHPQVDCGADTGVSRRHCQLSTDGQRWWVEDLQSSNGTYVSPAGEALPTDPVPAGQRRELDDGDRVYVGAWTRLVVRRALPGEV